MNTNRKQRRHPNRPALLRSFALALVVLTAASAAQAVSVAVTGVNRDGTTTAVGSYRWTIEEDRTYHVAPGAADPYTLSVIFHPSYMPVVAQGDEADLGAALAALDPSKHYYISVVPKVAGSWAIGGAQIAPGNTVVTVYMNQLPLPTAQISVFVFEDDEPLNNAPDLPGEEPTPAECPGLHCMEGFTIVLEDAGGRYGISAGVEMADAFGNPLGTEYAFTDTNLNGRQDRGEPFVVDAEGQPTVLTMGTGIIETGPDGYAYVRNLAPGKYGITVVPPAGQAWQQTSTIEGTKIIDAWVKANEPKYFQEFGPPGPHVFVGFVKPINDTTVLKSGATIAGQIVNLHMSRPPDYAFYNGAPFEHTTLWVGLNLGAAGTGRAVYARRANADGSFSIPNVPTGGYQLVFWDENLDLIFGSLGVNVNGNDCNGLGGCNLGEIPAFDWFTSTHHEVFYDDDEDGFRDPGEEGIPEQNINLRWRDGTINQAAPTDGEGFVPFDETFPFFAWQVAEVDFARFKATGVTVTVDAGGPIPDGNPWSWDGQLNPQPQCLDGVGYDPDTGTCPIGLEAINPNTDDNLTRTDTGPVLVKAYQGFLNQESVMQWGKKAYGPDENGGVSGVVFYSTTRAENDPRYGAPEPWEPGIPRVPVQLWDGSGTTLLAEVTTDSWDDSQPTGCQGEVFVFDPDGTAGPIAPSAKDCFDGLRNFNQVRDGVFDGGYAFMTCESTDGTTCTGIGIGVPIPLPAGIYRVAVLPPAGYEIVKEQDKNVDFGESYTPSTLALPQLCVNWDDVDGDGFPGQTLPGELDLFPGVAIASTLADGHPAAGVQRPLCDRKQVRLSNGQNAAADFYLFTKAPIAGHIYGFILDDTANEFDPNAPNFGEKYAPPFLPISIRDWTGREIGRTYSDQYGVYNALVPSTYTANQPKPSGMAPNMITVCLNSPKRPDPATPGQFIDEEFFNPQYSQFCYTFQYMPGTTTYLDTPVVPVAAFAGPDQFPLDCEFPTGTPKIKRVDGLAGGPYVDVSGGPQTITITSEGSVLVKNPAWDYKNPGSNSETIARDYGFGGGTTAPTVTLGTTTLPVVSWNANSITATVPTTAQTGQLSLTRGDTGKSTIAGLTLTVERSATGKLPVVRVRKGVTAAGVYPSVQAGIDAAAAGSLVLVEPGNYEELVVMWKPVRLQGYGPALTSIDAVKAPAEKLQAWRDKVEDLHALGAFDLLPSQEANWAGIEPDALFNEQGPAIIVLAKNATPNQGGFGFIGGQRNARIDGFTLTGADHAGGIMVNGYARFLEIANNRVIGNHGFYGGGIRVGHPTLTTVVQTAYENANNSDMSIHNNHITQNGSLDGAGGGLSLCTGSTGYLVIGNYVCGNFSMGQGGGIGHYGLSNGGRIASNWVIFNESFNQGQTVNGGGIFIGGGAPLLITGQFANLSDGSGSVTVANNLILGNAAGAGDGGGIRTDKVNGRDVRTDPNQPFRWYAVDIVNNMIVNNVAALAGGGISLQDSAMVRILHNTIAHNDSTATAGEAFPNPNQTQSTPQPAGIVSRKHAPELDAAFGPANPVQQYRLFSNPDLRNNVIWENRSFYFSAEANVPSPSDPIAYGLVAATPAYQDLAVLGVTGLLNPRFCTLTSLTATGLTPGTYHSSNSVADPLFVREYFNGDRGQTILVPETTTPIQAPAAFGEGGNFIKLRFGPLTLNHVTDGLPYGDYHIQATSPARQTGQALNQLPSLPDLPRDFDGNTRPNPTNTNPDKGADERP
jgi:hypothetical protein